MTGAQGALELALDEARNADRRYTEIAQGILNK